VRGRLSPAQRRAISDDATDLITAPRAPQSRPRPVEQLLGYSSLSMEEGLALMGLAEALLRLPDDATALMLVRERLASGDWPGTAAASRTNRPNAELTIKAQGLTAAVDSRVEH
jgi:RHH-type proline utilization regulon transcriptional repressor/proline dehydrogenase/delta 1-pyrroline-5-carboxylate dehydrogenase